MRQIANALAAATLLLALQGASCQPHRRFLAAPDGRMFVDFIKLGHAFYGWYKGPPKLKTRLLARVRCPRRKKASGFFAHMVNLQSPSPWDEILAKLSRRECNLDPSDVSVGLAFLLEKRADGKWEQGSELDLDQIFHERGFLQAEDRVELVLAHVRSMEEFVGFDLGTTFTSAALRLASGVCFRVKDDHDVEDYPSVVSVDPNDCRLRVGEQRVPSSPHVSISQVKRLLGRDFDDPVVQEVRKQTLYPLDIVVLHGSVTIVYQTEHGAKCEFSPLQVEAKILEHAKFQVERHSGAVVKKAVISIPAELGEVQRQEMLRLAYLTGLTQVRLVAEPVLAAYHHFQVHANDLDENIILLVIDVGGGSTDATLMRKHDGRFEVLDKRQFNLGGVDITHCVYEWLKEEIQSKVTLTTKDLKDSYYRAEDAKVKLSTRDVYSVHVENQTHSVEIKLYRAQFEKRCASKLTHVVPLVQRLLNGASKRVGDVDRVLMVGGSSWIPLIRKHVEQHFGKRPLIQDPRAEVACGAALLGSRVRQGDLVDTILYSLGVDPFQPCDASELAGVLDPDVDYENFRGVCSKSKMEKLIPRGAALPASRTSVHCNLKDNQRGLTIGVFSGEDDVPKKNTLVKYFEVSGLPGRPMGHDCIWLNFSVDQNGVLHALATPKTFDGDATEMKVLVDVLPHQMNTSELEHIRFVHDMERLLDERQRMVTLTLDQYENCVEAARLSGDGDLEAMRKVADSLLSIRKWAPPGGARGVILEADMVEIVERLGFLNSMIRSGHC